MPLLSALWNNVTKVASYVDSFSRAYFSKFVTTALQLSSIKFKTKDTSVKLLSWKSIVIDNIALNSDFLERYTPYTVPLLFNKFTVSNVKLSWKDGTIHVEINDIKIGVDVSSDVLKKEEPEKEPLSPSEISPPTVAQEPSLNTEEQETLIVIDNWNDAMMVLRDHIDHVLKTMKVSIANVQLESTSNLSITNEEKHVMSCFVDAIESCSFDQWRVSNLMFYVCPTVPALIMSGFSLTLDEREFVVAQFSETDSVTVGVCGDSTFIFSMFIQQILENQRILSKNYVDDTNFDVRKDEKLSRYLSKGIAESMSSLITETKSTIEPVLGKNISHIVRGIEIRNLCFTLDLYKGSDYTDSRIRTEKFTIKGWDGRIKYDIFKESLVGTVKKIQSTVGYIDDKITFRMQYLSGYWDLDLDIPEIYIRTSQHIVDKTIILFTFNNIWNEYDILYNQGEDIKFRLARINDINIRFKYYNSPLERNKILTGNWKQLVRLVPHCDLSITFPNVTLKYQEGWGDLVDAYVNEMLTSQKVKCVKKVIVGTTKRKLKKLFTGK